MRLVSASALFDLCAEWKAVCLEAVESTIGGTIEHSFIAPAPPAIDCVPQLAIYPGGPAVADTQPLSPPLVQGVHDRVSGTIHLVNLTCVVVRCSPTPDNDGNPPSIEDLELAAAETSEDVWAIWNFTRQRHKSGDLFPSPGGSRELLLDPAFPIPPGGDAVGWQIPIRVALGGYVVPAAS